jgi:serine/threonine protein kinase
METKKKVYLTLEYASGGSLFEYIISQGRIHESEAKILVKQMVSAFSYMHGLNIAHRDIKAENILLDYLKNIKITDFGLSISHEPKSLLSTACGSPIYSAPEVIDGKRYSGSEADVWSLGINIYAMVVGDLPFADSNVSALYASICKGHYTVPEFVSPGNNVVDLKSVVIF